MNLLKCDAMKKIFLLIIAVIAIVQSESGMLNAQNMHTRRTDKNISYRPELQADSDVYAYEMCRLDIYAPTFAKDVPVVVWFHGGGLTEGRRDIPEPLVEAGFVVATMDYRLSPKVKVTECIDDAAAAVAWVEKNIAKYGGDPSKIYLAGHSAGAYLILMLGLDKQYLAKYGTDADNMAALLSYSAQVVTHQTSRRENGISNLVPVIDEMAPLYHVRADAPPILLMVGDREMEMLGRYEENAYFDRMMKLVGHKNTILYEFDGFDHGGMPLPGHDVAVRYIKKREANKN